MATERKNNSYNPTAVKALTKKYSLTSMYIRQCLKGVRNNLTADSIRKDYKNLVKEVENLINKQ